MSISFEMSTKNLPVVCPSFSSSNKKFCLDNHCTNSINESEVCHRIHSSKHNGSKHLDLLCPESTAYAGTTPICPDCLRFTEVPKPVYPNDTCYRVHLVGSVYFGVYHSAHWCPEM